MSETHDGFLRGRELVTNIWRLEDEAERVSLQLEAQGGLGVRAPEMLARLGDGLSLLAQIASCAWGCRRADHLVENLVRRLCNASTACLRLAYLGYYDESLGVVRGAAELTNLLQLFSVDPAEQAPWLLASRTERIARYGPAAVRHKIEAKSVPPVIDEATYRALCELAIHVTPSSAFTSHDLEGSRVYIGSQFSITGLLLVLSELAYVVGTSLSYAGALTGQRAARLDELDGCKQKLLTTLSWLRVTNYEAVLKYFRERQEERHSGI